MGGKRFLFVFAVLGGSASGLVTAALLDRLDPGYFPLVLYPLVVAINVLGFAVGGWLTWLRWARSRQEARARIIAQLASGNLATGVTAGESQEDVRRLILSLRRALFQVQRVTGNIQRTGKGVGEQSQALLEAARRQGAAVDRSLGSVQGMGNSLQVAGERLTQVATFAEETTAGAGGDDRPHRAGGLGPRHARPVRAAHHRARADHERGPVRGGEQRRRAGPLRRRGRSVRQLGGGGHRRRAPARGRDRRSGPGGDQHRRAGRVAGERLGAGHVPGGGIHPPRVGDRRGARASAARRSDASWTSSRRSRTRPTSCR